MYKTLVEVAELQDLLESSRPPVIFDGSYDPLLSSWTVMSAALPLGDILLPGSFAQYEAHGLSRRT